uniref:Tyrosine-protein kinase ephrin type A/B receptor-like domain-containing protein n=1 Tax=Meloidogyne enterolobii TaxID=390850 RepID=A0A6V7Y8Y9_MELEN|nr:unnamed protein product [Meloidogyne enterolobii]
MSHRASVRNALQILLKQLKGFNLVKKYLKNLFFRIQNCIPCPDGRITGGVSGCIYLSDCFKNCSSGYIYIWGNDKCTPCPRGQFMPYSGRLKCLACPIDRTTGSINKEECSIKCKDGEEMGQNEQCQPCSKGTFREGLMSVCQRCQIGFTTKKEGSLKFKRV